ncbi:hypothetical protein OPT61_g9789 [Boeremia exigua]|uniref:Uncharacterized protein n=1 Tax=Boeremia exigua TaxID=749465 RepID=A0ACC2HTJ1_9PLEO|nr:hypothetical protein OPT61_g9789 [Boeremia exigua]
MHYISATRRKSCAACVKSKRRCDLEYPFCRRCSVKGLDCTYPATTSSRDRNVVKGRRTSPEPSPRVASAPIVDSSADFLPFNGAGTDPPGQLARRAGCAGVAAAGQCLLRAAATWANAVAGGRFADLFDRRPSGISPASTAFVRPFHGIHRVNPVSAPEPVEALPARVVPGLCVAICTVPLQDEREQLLDCEWHQLQDRAVKGRVSYLEPSGAPRCRPDPDHLPDHPSVRPQHERPGASPEAQRPARNMGDAPLEAVFRRAHDACQLPRDMGVQRIAQTHIHDIGVPVLCRIPFTRDLQAWKADPEKWNSSVLPELLESDGLTAYTDFSDTWTHEDELETLDPFGRLLLAACRGVDDPRLLS